MVQRLKAFFFFFGAAAEGVGKKGLFFQWEKLPLATWGFEISMLSATMLAGGRLTFGLTYRLR